jgi:zinc and cadmium transporter
VTMQSLLAVLCLASPIILTGIIAFALPIRASNLRLILAFSAAYLFSLSIIHMLPEAITVNNAKQAGLFIVIGFSLQLIIDTFSTGIEHGHVHLHSNACHSHLPYGIIIGLFLHSLLEGLPVYSPSGPEGAVNYQLILGLGVHNLPITIALVALLKDHHYSRTGSLLIVCSFALMSPLGYLLSYVLHTIGFNAQGLYSQMAYALVIGIFLHISTAILFESSDQHRYNFRKVAVMLLGIVVAYMMS